MHKNANRNESKVGKKPEKVGLFGQKAYICVLIQLSAAVDVPRKQLLVNTFKAGILKSNLQKIIRFLCIFVVLSSASITGSAQNNTGKKKGTEATEPARLIDRFAFKANALEWLITVPNFGVEFDLTHPDSLSRTSSRMTIGLTAKYNWQTAHTYTPPTVFNLMDIRPEFRYYWRARKMDRNDIRETKPSFSTWLKEDAFSVMRKDAKEWRAYYVGAYLSYGEYAFKFSKTGFQGRDVGLGVSLGWSQPLYSYKEGRSNIDLEFGLSLGALFATNYEKFAHDPDGSFYYRIENRGARMIPYPVISEIRIAFVYRTKSIGKKYLDMTEKEEENRRIRSDKVMGFYVEDDYNYEEESGESEENGEEEGKKKEKKVKEPKAEKEPKAPKEKKEKKAKEDKEETDE